MNFARVLYTKTVWLNTILTYWQEWRVSSTRRHESRSCSYRRDRTVVRHSKNRPLPVRKVFSNPRRWWAGLLTNPTSTTWTCRSWTCRRRISGKCPTTRVWSITIGTPRSWRRSSRAFPAPPSLCKSLWWRRRYTSTRMLAFFRIGAAGSAGLPTWSWSSSWAIPLSPSQLFRRPTLRPIKIR